VLERTHVSAIDLSIVIPVYNGAETLGAVISEISNLRESGTTPAGFQFRVTEVILVWDGGSPASADVIRRQAEQHSWIRGVWLSRNFGQHAATLAGMSSSGGEWVVTMDEDGQHDPTYIGAMLDVALSNGCQLVYAAPSTGRPHGFFRNTGSAIARRLFKILIGDSNFDQFHSYRLILGEVARGTAAYTGPGVYLDVALSWVVSRSATCPVPMRAEGRHASSYSFRKLLSHFGRLLISSGTRPLAIVSVVGFVFFIAGILYSIWVLAQRVFSDATPEGWASSFIATLVVGGLILFALGVIAQYLRTAVNMSLGKPLYVVVKDPQNHFPSDE